MERITEQIQSSLLYTDFPRHLACFSARACVFVCVCVAVNVIKTHVTSLQEEVVKLLTQQQLEDGVQLRLQALPGDGGQECLL